MSYRFPLSIPTKSLVPATAYPHGRKRGGRSQELNDKNVSSFKKDFP